LILAFGKIEGWEFADLPEISNIVLARVVCSKGECSRCFPHGMESPKSRFKKARKSWKNYRETRYYR